MQNIQLEVDLECQNSDCSINSSMSEVNLERRILDKTLYVLEVIYSDIQASLPYFR